MARTFLVLAALFGFLGVAAGAFGAHALRDRLAPGMLEVWKTGAQYQLVHALALGIVGALAASGIAAGSLRWAGWTFAAGIVLFSGSLYALALSGVRILGLITPFGGVLFLAGWALLGVAAARNLG